MTGIDTNIFVYLVGRRDLVKWSRARVLLRDLRVGRADVVLPWQVLGEFVRYLRTAEDLGQISRSAWMRYVRFVRRQFPLVLPTSDVLDRALELGNRYSLSHWDSMLLGACVEAGVDTLYTEDMGAPTLIGGVRLINPFALV